MKKKIISFMLTFVLVATGCYMSAASAKAESTTEDVDISRIWTEDALVGYTESQTWGIYLAQGVAIINDAGAAKIGAGGITTATRTCKVSVNAIVEKKVSGSWERVTSWTATDTSDISISTSKYVYITNGYYYRCRCIHRASTDVSSSCTSSLWM